MNVLNIIIVYFPFMAVSQVHEKSLFTGDFVKVRLTMLIACREGFTDAIQENRLQN